jgi:hypothetical protein
MNQMTAVVVALMWWTYSETYSPPLRFLGFAVLLAATALVCYRGWVMLLHERSMAAQTWRLTYPPTKTIERTIARVCWTPRLRLSQEQLVHL